MKHLHGLYTAITVAFLYSIQLYAGLQQNADCHLRWSAKTTQDISMIFETGDLAVQGSEIQGERCTTFALQDEGQTGGSGYPLLPAISRYVIVPPRAGVLLEVTSCESITMENLPPPKMYTGASESGRAERLLRETDTLYPPQAVVMSDPVVMRGVRMVMVTVYPVQFNPETGNYIRHDRVDVNLRFTDDEPINPVEFVGHRRNRSPEFTRMLRALVVNGGEQVRDEGEIGRDYVGHYLVVSHDSCLQYAIPLIEWKRRAGYKVDILRFSHEDAHNVDLIRASIQYRYDEYLEEGIDPFDYILLLGDRPSEGHQNAPWNLYARIGDTSMRDLAHHADYEYGLLEGNDHFADAAVGRFASGNRDMMETAVARTLSYEMTPWLEETDWIERAGVFTQAWADFSCVIVHTARWGEQMLRNRGFTDIWIQETNGVDDPQGNIIGPVIANWFNEGMSIMVGRAPIQYWNQSFRGVNNNTVFPIYISISAHGESSADNMFRTGDIDNLKGPASMIYSWGDPSTIYNNAFYLATVSGVLAHDMTLGWGRNYAGASFPRIFQTFEDPDQAMRQYQSDTDLYGDPGIQPWIGVPRMVEASFPHSISPGTNQVEVTLFEENTDNVVSGAQVTLYYPGELPDATEYHDWQPEYMVTGKTDASGKIRLLFDPQFDSGTLYLTVTGRDIYPLLDEIEIAAESVFITVSEYELDDSEGGNGDGIVNPGETVDVTITAANFGNEGTAVDVQAKIHSASPYLTVAEHDPLIFGDIDAGADSESNSTISFIVNPACPDGSEPVLYVNFTSTNFIWSSTVTLDVWGPNLEVHAIEDGNLVTEEMRNLELEVINNGRIDAPEMTARLMPQGYGIEIDVDEANYPSVAVNESATANGNPFRVSADAFAVPGNLTPMMLIFYDDGIAIDTALFDLQVNESTPNAPFGPDDYDYYCYDGSDEDWQLAPRWDWFEISPRTGMQDGNGTLIEKFDTVQVNGTEIIELPFKMRFYGREYDTITVGTSGFIGMGDQRRMVNLQNFPMELAFAGPVGMIAPFWTRLYVGGRNEPGVFYYYDERDNRFIIEWYNVHHETLNDNLNFEVIIHDPAYHPTLTGDSDILFYYQDIFQIRGPAADMPYASVGISSPNGTTGLSYTYHNQYHAGADSIGRHKAILFTTNLSYTFGATCGHVYDDATDEPVSGVKVRAYADFGIEAVSSDTTNADGGFSMVGLIGLNINRIEAIKEGYRGVRVEMDTLQENDTLDMDIFLLRPRIRLNREEVREFLVPDHKTRHHVGINNNGSGCLEFIVNLEDPIDERADANPGNRQPLGKSRDQVMFTSWIDVEPRTGVLEPGEWTNILITFDTRGLGNGDYLKTIVIEDTLAQVAVELPVNVNIDEENGLIDPPEQPLEWSLDQNYPNPYNSSSTIHYSLKEAGRVRLTLFDINGRVVRTLADGEKSIGRYHVTLDGSELTTGLYIYRLEAGSFTATRKMVLVR